MNDSLAKRPVKILVGGDVCPTRGDEALFKSGDVGELLNDYWPIWKQADCTLLNLECPLSDSTAPIEKIGPHLKASPDCIAFFKAARATGLILANNHIRDYGEQGVTDTLQACQSAGVKTVGAGGNLEQARRPLSLNIGGWQLGILAMAEQEFNLAGVGSPGANPIDYENFTLTRELKSRSDFVLVLLHAGTEMLPFPRPGLAHLCRFLVDQGADAVIVQHTHCAGCYETYRHAPIIYGQGNCIFGLESTPVEQMAPSWFLGMLVELRLGGEQRCELNLYPYEQSRGFCGLRLLSAGARETFLDGLSERSKWLQDPAALRQKWFEFCRSRRRMVLPRNLGIDGFLASIDHRLGFSRMIDAVTNQNLRWQMLMCESHRELLADCLRMKD